MEITVMVTRQWMDWKLLPGGDEGAVLALVSVSYVTLTSWSLGQLSYAPRHLAFNLACSLSFLTAAICGLFSACKWRHTAFLGILLFASLGVVLAMPTITTTMLAIDREGDECKICQDEPLDCNRLCRDYKAMHVALFLVTLVAHIAGSVLWSATYSAVFRSMEKSRIAEHRRALRQESELSYSSSNGMVSWQEDEQPSG